MSWTTPMTYVAAAVLTAAQQNTYVRDNTNFLYAYGTAGTKPSFNVYGHSLTQSVANSSEVAPTSGTLTVGEDSDSGLSSTYVYSIQRSGVWLLRAQAQWATSGAGGRAIHFSGVPSVNPWVGVAASSDPSSKGQVVAMYMDRLNVGASVQATVWQGSGGALNMTDYGFMGVWLGN